MRGQNIQKTREMHGIRMTLVLPIWTDHLTVLGTNIHMPYQGTFEDAFPFPSMGCVNSPGVYFL